MNQRKKTKRTNNKQLVSMYVNIRSSNDLAEHVLPTNTHQFGPECRWVYLSG